MMDMLLKLTPCGGGGTTITERVASVSAFLNVDCSDARCPNGNRMSSICAGHAATVAWHKEKLLQRDQHPSSDRFTSAFRTGFNYSSRLCLRIKERTRGRESSDRGNSLALPILRPAARLFRSSDRRYSTGYGLTEK